MAILCNLNEPPKHRNAHSFYAIGACARSVLQARGEDINAQPWHVCELDDVVSAEYPRHALEQVFKSNPRYTSKWRFDDETQRVVFIVSLASLLFYKPGIAEPRKMTLECGAQINIINYC
jgi:hypothetical protein